MTKIVQRFFLLLAAAWPWLAQSQTAETITIDNTEAILRGDWTQASSSGDRLGKDYRFASTIEAESPTSSATYTPDFKVAGKYHVEILYPQGQNRSTIARWFIKFEGGSETVTVNQQMNGGNWVRIATAKPFAAGTSGYVEVQNNTGKSGSVVVADGVRFVPATGSSGAVAERPGTGASTGARKFSLKVEAGFGGVVAKTPDKMGYDLNEEVSLLARAEDGYVFDGWSVGSGTNKIYRNPWKVKITKDQDVKCHFAAAGLGVIMDNDDDGVSFEGLWTVSKGSWPGKKYDSYHVTSARAQADAKATFRPNLPRTGKYDIYVWYAHGRNRSAATPWLVSGKGGKTTSVTVNQTTHGGRWFSLATGVEMEAGSKPNQFVQVSNNTPDHDQRTSDGGRVVIADAVAFVYVGE